MRWLFNSANMFMTSTKTKMGSKAHVKIVQGFTVLQVKFSEKSKAAHFIYLKDHSTVSEDSCKPKDRTLFILNIPPYCDERCLRRIFSSCGKVLHVYLPDKPSSSAPPEQTSKFFQTVTHNQGFKVAYIVFKSPGSVQKAKQLPHDKCLILSTEEEPILTGVRKWCKQYEENRIDVKELQKEIDSYMEEYDRKQEEEKQKAKEMEGVPDEEGWMTVTRHGKNKGAPRTEVREQKITSKEKKRRKEKELINFYSFQIRESKREQIADLRKKFEEDKQRISLMKASRKFKPY